MVRCRICDRDFKSITNTHLQIHGLSFSEYRSLFPNAALVSEEVLAKLSVVASGRTGWHHSEESKEKMRQKAKGRLVSVETRKKISRALMGRRCTPETRSKISRSHKGMDKSWLRGPRKQRLIRICPFCGVRQEYLPWEARLYRGFCSLEHWYAFLKANPSAHPNWRGGISREPYDFGFDEELKEEIRSRDGYTCQLCGETGGGAKDGRDLAVHHIDYDKSNSSRDNLISLCARCNSRVNFSRAKWEESFLRREIDG